MQNDDLMTGLPGEELLRRGLSDVEANRRTTAGKEVCRCDLSYALRNR